MMLSFLIRQGATEPDTPFTVAAFEQRTNILCWADTADGSPCRTPGIGALGLCKEHREEKTRMTPDETWAEVRRLHDEADRLAATLPSDYFLHDDFTFRHSDMPRGEGIEASEIEGVSS